MEEAKVNLGMILAITGSALAFLKAIGPAGILDYLGMALGVGLIGVYCVLTWDWYQEIFGKDASIVLFAPPLVSFGGLAVFFSLTTDWMVPPHDKVVLALGVALIVIPVVLLGNSLKG